MKTEEFMKSNERKLLAITMLLAVVALSASLLATPWNDEVFYVSPGGSWATDGGFTSSDWNFFHQVKTWGLSNPGLPVLMGLWLKVFGFGQIQAHAFFFVVYATGLAGLIRWLGGRYQMTVTQMATGLLIGLFVHSFNHDAIYHARPDCFWPALFWGFLKVSFDEGKNSQKRLFEGSLLGMACIFLGLHFAGFFAVGAAALFIYHRNKASFYAGLGLAIGLIIGLFLLRLAFGQMGVWQDFVNHRSMHFARPLQWELWWKSKDFWLIGPALGGLLLNEILSGRGLRGDVGRAALLGAGIFVLVPPVIHTIGYYQASYTWMVIAPVCLVVMPKVVRQPFGKGGWFNVLVLVLAAGGVMLRSVDIVQGVFDYRRRQEFAKVATTLIPAADSALISESLYYDLGRPANRVFLTYQDSGPAPAAVTEYLRWMVMTAADAKIIKARLGGSWEVLHESSPGPFMMWYGNYVVLRKLP